MELSLPVQKKKQFMMINESHGKKVFYYSKHVGLIVQVLDAFEVRKFFLVSTRKAKKSEGVLNMFIIYSR